MTTYLYEDTAHPDRVTSSVTTPEWTDEDHAALLGLQMYEATLCNGCGQPKAEAWHAGSDGYYEGRKVKCFACSSMNGDDVAHGVLTAVPTDTVIAKFQPFDLLKSTAEPTKKE